MVLNDGRPQVADLEDFPQVSGVQIIVRQETPFLPKVAFVLITLASLAGATFTGVMVGLTGFALFAKWVTLWSIALAGGFAVWRVFYLRDFDREADQRAVQALNSTALKRAKLVGRYLAVVATLGLVGPFTTSYLSAMPALQWAIVALQIVLIASLLIGADNRNAATVAVVASFSMVALWAYADAGPGWWFVTRLAHLAAFTLWLGGAVWNIWVAMPAGRDHPNVDAVIAGAHQLDRFRWVVRFALPTIIITGLLMAGVYRMLPLDWWLRFPGILIPSKVLAIVALVVVFITCPLFRHCSPVQGVCDLDDLSEEPGDVRL